MKPSRSMPSGKTGRCDVSSSSRCACALFVLGILLSSGLMDKAAVQKFPVRTGAFFACLIVGGVLKPDLILEPVRDAYP